MQHGPIDLVDLRTLLQRAMPRSRILCAEADLDDVAAGGAYALLGRRLRQDHAAQSDLGIVTPSRGKILFDGVDITPLSTQSAISRRCSVSGDLRHHEADKIWRSR